MNEKKYFFITSFQRSGSNWLTNCLDFSDKIEVSGEIYPSMNIQVLENIRPADKVSHERLSKNNAYKLAIRAAINELMRGNISNYKKSHIMLLGDKSAYGLTRYSIFKHNNHISKITEYFPDAKQILLIRDIRDIVVSYSNWKSGHKILSLNPLCFLRFILIVVQWCLMNNRWYYDCKVNSQCLVVEYKDLKTDFLTTIKKIYNHLEIDIDNDQAIKIKERLYDINSSFFKDVNRKRGYNFYRKGEIGEWKTKLKWYHKVLINIIVGKTLKKFGYL